MPRVVATNPNVERDRSTLSLHNLSCRSFRVHLEIIHNLRETKLGAPVVMVVWGPMKQRSGQVICL